MSCHNGYPRAAVERRRERPDVRRARCPRASTASAATGRVRLTSMRSQRGDVEAGRRAIVNPGEARSGAAARSVHAVPSRVDEQPAAVSDSAVRAPAVFICAGKAAGATTSFISITRRRAGARRQVRDRGRRVPPAQVGMLSAQRDDLPHVSQPARHPARAQSGRTLRRGVPELPPGHASQGMPRVRGCARTPPVSTATCRSAAPRMPSTSSMTDHYIQRRGRRPICWRRAAKPTVSSTATIAARSRSITRRRCRRRRTTSCIWPLRRFSRDRISLRGIPRLEQAIEKHRPTRPEFYYELARAYARTSNYDAVIRWCQEALLARRRLRAGAEGACRCGHEKGS